MSRLVRIGLLDRPRVGRLSFWSAAACGCFSLVWCESPKFTGARDIRRYAIPVHKTYRRQACSVKAAASGRTPKW
jgi:hypothetical protein